MDKCVTIKVANKNIDYYEKKGYYIPRHIDKSFRSVVKVGTHIQVKVEDLSIGCTAKVNVLCPLCKEVRQLRYCNVRPSHVCKKCAARKAKIPKRGVRNKAWVLDTFKRDNFSCQKCFCGIGLKLVAHKNADSSGTTLCSDCHDTLHAKHGETITQDLLKEFLCR